MNGQDPYHENDFELLREKAEDLLERLPDPDGETVPSSADEILALIQEVRVHQAELAVQNEELKSAQGELQSLHEEYVENFFEDAPFGYIILQREGYVSRANRTALSLLGAARYDLKNTPFRSLLHEGSQDRYIATVQGVLAGKEAAYDEWRLAREEERPVWIHVDIRPDADETGRVHRLRMALTDISYRIRLEKLLKHNQEHMEWVLKQTGIGTWLNELPFGRLNWDGNTKRLFFVPPERKPTIELFWSRLHPDDREPTRKAVERSIRDGTLYDIHHRAVEPETGKVRWIRSAGRASYAPDGTPKRFDGINYDISDQIEAQDILRRWNESLESRAAKRTRTVELQARQLKSLAWKMIRTEEQERKRIARLLHDDLQQQLAAVKMRMEMLTLDRQGAEDPSAAISTCVDLLFEAIQTTRRLSRDLSPRHLHRDGLIAGIGRLAAEMKERYGLETTVAAHPDAEPDSPEVSVLLYESLKELLFNVVKHAGVNAARVVVAKRNDGISLSVEDAGDGGDPQGELTRRESHAGLGLFSIEERVRDLGGRMTVDAAPGRGWNTTLFLPGDAAVEPVDAGPGPEMDPAAESGEKQGDSPLLSGEDTIRILIADDHHVMREGLAKLLNEQEGFAVIGQVGTGREAVAFVRRLRPDIILMDVDMPEMNGVDATQILHRMDPGIPVMGLTIHDDPLTAQSIMKAGASACRCKSDPPDRIIEAVRGLAAERRREPQA